MRKQSDVSLKPYNTFRVDVKTKDLYQITNIDNIQELIRLNIFKHKFYILGGGSNTLFTKDYDGAILKVDLMGKNVIEETDDFVKIKVASGEDFTSFVEWTVKNNYLGLQNLAWIPGTVGATPVQNVGAYGSEIKDVLESVEYIDLESGNTVNILGSECKFGYRDSIFKHELKGKALITSVTFVLQKISLNEEIPEKYLEYAGIQKTLSEDFSKPYTLNKVYEAICQIRKEKLPDIQEYGSCGSTFENPIIPLEQYGRLKEKYPELPSYPTDKPEYVKIPVAYIFEKLGWKEKRCGDAGTWKHPLIVTNYGNASAQELLDVIKQMQEDFYNDTHIKVETEINII